MLFLNIQRIVSNFSTPIETPVYLNTINDPSQEITVRWNTIVPSPSIIEIGKTPSNLTTVENEYQTFNHEVLLENLEPNTTYFYRVPEILDEITNFTTAPLEVSTIEDIKELHFIVYGDNREYELTGASVQHDQLVKKMINQNLSISFILNTGDLVQSWGDLDSWGYFFQHISPISKSTLYIPVVGNHDWNSNLTPSSQKYTSFFSSPTVNQYYSMKYGSIGIYILNNELDLETQANWLEQELNQTEPEIHWKIVAFHKPPYSPHPTRQNNTEIIETLVPLFETYGIDIVFNGHDHFYMRFSNNNVTYITTGGGGAPLYNPGDTLWVDAFQKEYHFCLGHIEGNSLTVNAVSLNGTLLDTFSIVK